jgi:tetratricopeptide (TPR) repeat protein
VIKPESVVDNSRQTDTASLLAYISELLGREEYAAALIQFDKIRSEDAEKLEIRLLKASTLVSAGRSGEARRIADTVLSGDPRNVPALLVLAAVEEAQGRSREQRAVLERALAVEPDNVPALVSMGQLMIRSNATPLAGPYFDRALAADPGNGEALLGRAWVYRNSRDQKNALALLDRAVKLHPRWARAFQERGRLHKAAGSHHKALEDLTAAKTLEPDSYFIACDLGDALNKLNRKEDALAEYQRAIAIDPGQFMAYVFSSGLKDELEDYDGAFRDYEIITRLRPDYYFAFEGLGMHFMRRREWLAARDAFMEAYKRAFQMDQGNTDGAMYALLGAVCWLRGGKPQDARPFMDEALRRMDRNSLEYRLLRLFRDSTGDVDLTNSIDREKNPALKARMLYYLASYYDIRGNRGLAQRLFLQVKDLGITDIPEWRLNQWALEARGLTGSL